MTMTRWSPMAELEELRRKMDQLLQKSSRLLEEGELPKTGWQPTMEVFESESLLLLELDLPGISQEEIQVRIEEHTLLVSGERKPTLEEGFSCQRCERSYGPFQREFALPEIIDESQTRASCEHGVLRIWLQKRSSSEPRRIDVEIR